MGVRAVLVAGQAPTPDIHHSGLEQVIGLIPFFFMLSVFFILGVVLIRTFTRRPKKTPEG